MKEGERGLVRGLNDSFYRTTLLYLIFVLSVFPPRTAPPRGGGGTPYIGMCGPKGYGFSAVLVINRVSILADFDHFGHK